MAEESFLIKDPVHGSIELCGGYLRKIIDSEEFQRLRKIKQLGGASYVYPGATHTRFEHSIGVCYIASELLKSLKEKDESFNRVYKPTNNGQVDPMLKSDIKCVKIAALCHDLGHGPFSHLYDLSIDKCIRDTNQDANHEYRSVKIFNKICNKLRQDDPDIVTLDEKTLVGKLITFCEDYKKGLEVWKRRPESVHDPDNIDERQILNDIPNRGSYEYPSEKMFLFEIVANGFTGIDVDKMDYFLRDGHMTGLPSIFEWRRYIQTLKVLKNKEINHLCSRDKEERELYQLFHIRTQLYHQVYRHKTTIAVEHMIGEALKEANKTLFIRRKGHDLHILEAWKDIDSFLLLDDSVEDIIMLDMKLAPSQPSPDINIAHFELNGTTIEAKAVFENIRKRKLCKYIGDSSPPPFKEEEKIQEEKIQEEIKKLNEKKFSRRDVIFLKKAKFSYGMGEDQNPIAYHYFYKKGDSTPFCNKLQPSVMLPEKFEETKWKCYVKEETNDDLTDIKKVLGIK